MQREPAVARDQRAETAERGQRRQPAEAPGEGGQVVPPAAGVGQAELAALVAGGLGLLADAVVPERVAVEQRVRVERPGTRRTISPSENARLRTRAWATGEANAAATIVTTTIPAGYLVAIATPSAAPASTYSRVPAGAVDPGHADQAQRQRRQRRRVVQREVRVVHGQERDRQQRAREEPDALVLEQPRAGDRGQRHGERAEERATPRGRS